jgi:SnoaL-like polyketide cyclase
MGCSPGATGPATPRPAGNASAVASWTHVSEHPRGNYVACQTSIAGRFVREFTHGAVGALPPTGDPVVFDLLNVFRYDGDGRLAEEWIQTDNRSVLRQLGAEGR